VQRRKRSKKRQNDDTDADADDAADSIVSWVDFFCLHKHLACLLVFFHHTIGMAGVDAVV